MRFCDAAASADHIQTISTSLQADNHTKTSLLNFYRPDPVPDAKLTVSRHWRQLQLHFYQVLLISVKIWQSYCQTIGVQFLSGYTVYKNT